MRRGSPAAVNDGASRRRVTLAQPLPAALKFSINLSSDIGTELKRIAFEQRVSESSVIEIALRHLFRRVSPERLGTFLKQNGACLRRRSN